MAAKSYAHEVTTIKDMPVVIETVTVRPGWFGRLIGRKVTITVSRFFKRSVYWYDDAGNEVRHDYWLDELVREHNVRVALKRIIPPEQDITGDRFDPLRRSEDPR